MSWYLTITPSPDQPPAQTQPLIEFLSTIPELDQNGPMVFRSKEPKECHQFGFIILSVFNRKTGWYNAGGAFHPQINFVEVACSSNADPTWYDNLACRIAAFLGWVAVEEHADRQIYPPLNET